jgi:hypothetical protein
VENILQQGPYVTLPPPPAEDIVIADWSQITVDWLDQHPATRPSCVQLLNHILTVTIDFDSTDTYCTACGFDEKLNWLEANRTSYNAKWVHELWDINFGCTRFNQHNWREAISSRENFCCNCDQLCFHVAGGAYGDCPHCCTSNVHHEAYLNYQVEAYTIIVDNYREREHYRPNSWYIHI